MADDERTVVVPMSSWTAHFADPADPNVDVAGYRPVSIKFRDYFQSTGGKLVARFTTTYIKNIGAQATNSKVLVNTDAAHILKTCTDEKLRVIALDSYMFENKRQHAAVLVDNTGTHFRQTWFWVNVQPDFIEKQFSDRGARLIHLAPQGHPAGQPWSFDVVMIANTGSDYREWWYNYNMTLKGVSDFLAAQSKYNPRIYQLGRTKEPLEKQSWTAILIKKARYINAWFDPNKSEQELWDLAKQRKARLLDIVHNGEVGAPQPRFAATMLQCS